MTNKKAKTNPRKGKIATTLKPSAEWIAVMFSVMHYCITDANGFASAFSNFFAHPENKDNLKNVEIVLRTHLETSINGVCLMALAEKFLKQEDSPRAAVSFVYIGHRLFITSEQQEPGKKESQELWRKVWEFAAKIPFVAREMAEREEKGTLLDWKIDVQVFARRRWRTLKDQQIPRLKEESEIMQKRIVALFKFDS